MMKFALSLRLIAIATMAALLCSVSLSADAQQQRPRPAPARQAPAKPPAAPAQSNSLVPETAAKQAIILDFKTGAVLFAKDADSRMAPSSMSKMMTSYLVFKALKEGRLQLDSKLPVSQRA